VSPAHDALDPPTDELVMGLILGGSGGATWAWDGAKPNRSSYRRPGTLGLTPIGAQGRFEVDGPSRALIICLPYSALAERLAPDVLVPRDFGRLHDDYLDQSMARKAAMGLWRAAGREDFGRDLLIDALSEKLLLTLSGRLPDHQPGIRLDARQQARLNARAERTNVDVPALAGELGLPVRTFRRQFVATFGCSPHAWLIQRRIERARTMLADRSTSLAETALELGFASQAHFTEAFRQATGFTPGRYRRALLN
jgi:AraC-like DNA-binding protein